LRSSTTKRTPPTFVLTTGTPLASDSSIEIGHVVDQARIERDVCLLIKAGNPLVVEPTGERHVRIDPQGPCQADQPAVLRSAAGNRHSRARMHLAHERQGA
jgi:hypothetical protein